MISRAFAGRNLHKSSHCEAVSQQFRTCRNALIALCYCCDTLAGWCWCQTMLTRQRLASTAGRHCVWIGNTSHCNPLKQETSTAVRFGWPASVLQISSSSKQQTSSASTAVRTRMLDVQPM